MFTQLTAKQGMDKTIDSSSNLPSEPVFLWLHPDLLPWWWIGLVCPFQTVFHLPNRWSIAYIPCILISWVQLRRWPHVSDLQIWGGGVFPLVRPYSAKGDVRERAETVSCPFHLDISLYSWDSFPDFVCGGVGGALVCVQVHMHVCKHTCRSQGQSQTVFLGNHPLGFWDRVSLWEAGLADWAGLTGQRVPETHLSPSSQHRGCPHNWLISYRSLFHIETPVPTLAQQALRWVLVPAHCRESSLKTVQQSPVSLQLLKNLD